MVGGKSVESDLPCSKHPLNPSSVGICAFCLKEKLMKLVCSDCREHRLCSCSCSDVSSYRNSSCTVDVGSVGRISFLIENEKGSNGDDQKTLFSHMKQVKRSETEDVVLLRRSSSCVVEVKKSNGFWRIGNLFEKKEKKKKKTERLDHSEKTEDCVMDVSRSRSLSSFMDGNLDLDVGALACSSEKVSDFNEYEARKSGISGGFVDFETGVSSKEMDDDDDDSGFIDLKIDPSEKSKTGHSAFKKYDPPPPDVIGSSSCRITVNERGIKKVKNSHVKAWQWIFKHHSGKKDFNHILES